MSGSSDGVITELEDQLEGAERTLSRIRRLSDEQAGRVEARMDRLASQLLEVSPPPAMDEVHGRLGTVPASEDDFAALVDRMGPADGEG